jgi:halocyanin-like protein
MTEHYSRRKVLALTGAVGGVALAGCSSDSGSGNGNSGDTTATTTATPTESSGNSNGGSGSQSFGGWMENVGNYNSIVDETGKNEVTVEVGTEGNGGAYAFAPPAIKIASGTTVAWEWTGKGSMHNVVDNAGNFESEMTDEAGHTFEHTFESGGTYKYYCEPHKTMGMKGVVVVE